MSAILVLGARNLGGAIADRYAEKGWDVATLSLSEETAADVRARIPDALAMAADAEDPGALRAAVGRVSERFGSLDAAVNAVSPPGGAPGRGELAEADPDAIDRYAKRLVPEVWTFFRVCGRAMLDAGAGALVQVTGGSARRAMQGKGAWAAGAFATRALSQAAALEFRERGVHAALLVVDGVIESDKTREALAGKPAHESVSQPAVVDAIEYLIGQSERAWSHELVITPRGDRWVP
ncbi:MAG: SDR family NAD(P)-dependent oxidoreductase [Gemmatimonadota bacterium]|nr:SDR family NAD(P)-dependent oxidoreductase [Gemmatimonadota bacterium]